MTLLYQWKRQLAWLYPFWLFWKAFQVRPQDETPPCPSTLAHDESSSVPTAQQPGFRHWHSHYPARFVVVYGVSEQLIETLGASSMEKLQVANGCSTQHLRWLFNIQGPATRGSWNPTPRFQIYSCNASKSLSVVPSPVLHVGGAVRETK